MVMASNLHCDTGLAEPTIEDLWMCYKIKGNNKW